MKVTIADPVARTRGTASTVPGRLERSLAVVDGVRAVDELFNITVAQLALAWNFHQPGVTSAIAGSRNPAHVRSNAEAGDVDLDEGTLAELEALLAARAGLRVTSQR